MCGRYVINDPISKTDKLVKSVINVKKINNFNAHPFQNLPVIKRYADGNTLENLNWGIFPSWAEKKYFKPLINARLETIDEKVSFKKLIQTTRCIVIADGFYEWKREKNNKIPNYIYRKDKTVLYFAGIYDEKQFCLITESASTNFLNIHHRQPVALNEEDIDNYLNLDNDGSNLLKKRNKIEFAFHEVTKNVNKTSNNDISLLQKL